MSRRSVSAKALERSYRAERAVTVSFGTLALVLGVLVLVLSFGTFGTLRAQQPLLDPVAVEVLAARPELSRGIAILAGVVACGLGCWWTIRSLRPERRPDIRLDSDAASALTVTGPALARAVRADAEQLEGVTKATVRTVGDDEHPALRLTVWLREGSDLRSVWHELNDQVLARARESLEREILPTAIHLELGAAQPSRVR
ncbi:MAG: alkaline shock response membrane anchor protein AmaP [Haloechinothrix sp.]